MAIKYRTRYQREKVACDLAEGYRKLMKGPHITEALEAITIMLAAPPEVRAAWEPIVDWHLEVIERTLAAQKKREAA